MIDKKVLIETLVGVYAFYDKELTEFAIRIWSDVLADKDIATVSAAFTHHLKDTGAGRFCPKPADILRHLNGDADAAAVLAWADVLDCVRYGGRGAEKIVGAARFAVDSLGGFSAIGRSDESDLGFIQKRFCEAFKVYRALDALPPVLALAISGAFKALPPEYKYEPPMVANK